MNLTRHAMRRTIAATAITSAAILLPAIALASSGSPAASNKAVAETAVAKTASAKTSAAKNAAANYAAANNAAANNAAAAGCPRGYLTSWLGIPGNGAAGSTYYELEISNVSGQTCTLYGYPGVSAVKGGGGQLGSAADRAPGHTELVVTLAPYQTAHVVLQITDVGVYSPSACHPANAVALRVYAPGDYSSMLVPFSFRACAKRGPIFLHVSTTIAGAGIPGYST